MADRSFRSTTRRPDFGVIDQFATPGDSSVAVLGGRPTAFRISQLPGASNEIATLRACMEELDLG